jgi:CheY-like chemotaxis protein
MIVNLITFRNKQFIPGFQKEGYETAEFSPLTETSQLRANLIKKSANYTLFEINDNEKTDHKKLSETIKVLYSETKLVCLCEKITPFISGLLLENGIADCLEHFNTERIISYINFLQTKPSQKNGTFLILNDNKAHTNMLNGIIKRFGYNTEFVTDGESLFSGLSDSRILMIIMNLGTSGIDLNGIVRKAYGNSDIKKFPVVAYKSLEQGLFVHEVLNGLNRLTKVIYSPQELFCMLIDLLFKKEIMTLSSEFNNSLNLDKFKSYAAAPIPQLYYSMQGETFSGECIFSTTHIDTMIKSADEITTSLVKIDGIRWLRLAQAIGDRPTCGAGG